MKHERNIRPEKKQHWRLKKTLARSVEVRPMDPDDIKYLWAAYKKGALTEMFAKPDMTSDEFGAAFDEHAERYSAGWVIVCHTKAGFRPAGVMFGNLAPMAAYLIVTGAAWFPWATHRNVIEGTVAFLNIIRRQTPAMFYARDEHKRLYEVVCMHGILRRIGTSSIVFPGRQAAVFETRV